MSSSEVSLSATSRASSTFSAAIFSSVLLIPGWIAGSFNRDRSISFSEESLSNITHILLFLNRCAIIYLFKYFCLYIIQSYINNKNLIVKYGKLILRACTHICYVLNGIFPPSLLHSKHILYIKPNSATRLSLYITQAPTPALTSPRSCRSGRHSRGATCRSCTSCAGPESTVDNRRRRSQASGIARGVPLCPSLDCRTRDRRSSASVASIGSAEDRRPKCARGG